MYNKYARDIFIRSKRFLQSLQVHLNDNAFDASWQTNADGSISGFSIAHNNHLLKKLSSIVKLN